MSSSALTERQHARLNPSTKYLNSSLTQRQFCQQEQLAYSTFQLWLKEYRRQNQPPLPPPPGSSHFCYTPVQSAVTNRRVCHRISQWRGVTDQPPAGVSATAALTSNRGRITCCR